MLSLNASNARRGDIDGFIPVGLSPLIVETLSGRVDTYPHEWLAKAIRVCMNVLEARGLWTNIASTEDILFVASYGNDVLSIVFYLNTAHRFAQVTGPVVNLSCLL
jgi:hypothetical protein